MELVQDRGTRKSFPTDASLDPSGGPGVGIAPELKALLWRDGVLIRSLPSIVKFGPPLTIESAEIDRVLELLDGLLARVDAAANTLA